MKMGTPLVNLLEGIKASQADADVDIDQYPMKYRPAKAIAKADGAKSLEAFKNEYAREFGNRSAVILITGSAAAQQAFMAVAKEIGGTNLLSASALEAYRKMADDVEPTIGREREFAGTQLGHLLRSVEAVGKEAGSSFLKTPTLIDGVFIVRTFDDLVTGIRDLLLPQVGAVLNRDYLQTVLLRQAIEQEFSASTAAIVVTDASPKEIEFFTTNLFNGVGIVVDLPEDVSKIDNKFVVATFDALRATKKQADNLQFNSSH
jgi:hypothetical protein